jgi:hypothetical protein
MTHQFLTLLTSGTRSFATLKMTISLNLNREAKAYPYKQIFL